MANPPVVPRATLREIRAAWLFSACSDDEIRILASMCTPLAVPAGREIIRMGEAADACFVVASGEATSERDGRTLGRFEAGAVIGAIALLDHTPHSATVTAVTGMRLFAVRRHAFAALRARGTGWSIQHRLDVIATEQRRRHSTMPVDLRLASFVL